ncbi:MAG: DNA translocase FtsK [Clostridia bacterium]|nr:DNA translocase FtsK [Clostridia bacterium]
MLISFIAMTDFAITRKIASLVRKSRESGIKKADEETVPSSVPAHPVTEETPKKKKKNRFTDAAEDIVPMDEEKPAYVSLPEAVEKLPRTGEKATAKSEDAEINIYTEPKREPVVKPFTPPKEVPVADDVILPPENGVENDLPDGEVIVKPKRLEGEIQVEISRENVQIPYTFPDTDLLNNIDAGEDRTNPQALRELSVKLVETLKSFNIDVKVLEISKGPAITRFELQPTAGVRVSKITSLADDIALSLAATAVRIEAPIPGKAAIGIEIPNESVATVSARDVLESKEFTESKSKLSIALGRDIAGKCIVGDIAKMPHVLIAGATGSGKSVCINSLIASILYKASPNEVKLIMIDPKVVELSVYNGIPHLLIPVVTDPRKAAGSLNWAVQEMNTRYKFFADEGVRDLKGYNAVMEREGRPRLPQIVIIIDELADLMMVAPKDVETYICRLAQLARAAGMHLVIATQRPSVNVITGVIKANIPSRIAFAVSSYIDSRTILDANGAEKLLGRGDMLYYPMGANKPTRVQGAFISDEEVERLVEFVKKDSEAVYDEDVLEQLEKAGEESSDGGDEDEAKEADALLPQAIEIVIDSGQASVSLVQRKLSVGYARAGRLVDQMEARGIVGPSEGSKPRRVLVTKAEYLAMLEGSGLNESKTNEDEDDGDIIMPVTSEYPAEDVYIPDEDEDDEDDIIIPPSNN